MPTGSLAKLGRELANRKTLEQVALSRSSDDSQCELLQIPFAQWCVGLRIKTDKGLQPFELFDWQQQTADLIAGDKALTRRAIALLSSRQTGKTSLLLALAAYLAQSRRQFTALIIHRTTQDAYLLCRRLKRFLDGVALTTDSLSLLEFVDSSSAIHFRSCNPKKADGAESAGRGLESVDLVVIDEASHTANLKDVLGVVAPTLTWSSMGVVCFVGTASSKQSYYYENLASAAGGAESLEKVLSGIREGNIAPFQILDTGKGAAAVITNWRAIDRCKNEPDFLSRVQNEFDLSDAQMDSEYELIFGSSVDSAVFDYGLVMAAQTEESPYEYQKSHVVYLGVDPAGQGKDFAVAVTLREIEKDGQVIYEVVDLYRKRSGTSEQHLSAVDERISRFRPLKTIVEKNAAGQTWVEHLAGRGYPDPIIGFATTAISKPVLIGRLQLALERGVLRIPRGPIIGELLAYRRLENGKLGASGNNHDDTVIALSLALLASGFNQNG